MRQLFGELLEHPYVLFDTATNETTCIISLEEEENSDFLIQGIVSQLNVQLAYRYDIEVHIGAGNPAPSVYSLHESYAQAHRVLHYREAFGS
jgi:sugar diacid utilization regulator